MSDYQLTDESVQPFIIVPNIIWELGLTKHEIAGYCYLLRRSLVPKGSPMLRSLSCGISKHIVKSLTRPHDLLGGESLIVIRNKVISFPNIMHAEVMNNVL